MITFAIDYDGTLTALNPRQLQAFRAFVGSLIDGGCRVVIVTYRSRHRAEGNADVEATAELLGVEVIYTDGMAKASTINDQHVIWVDDQPETILMDKGQLNP